MNTSNKTLSIKPFNENTAYTMLRMKQVDQSYPTSDIGVKLVMNMSKQSEYTTGVNVIALQQVGSDSKHKENPEEKYCEIGSSPKGIEELEIETLPIHTIQDLDLKAANCTDKSSKIIPVIKETDSGNTLNLPEHDDRKFQEEDSSYLNNNGDNHILEPLQNQGLKDCSDKSIYVSNGESVLQDLQKDEESEVLFENLNETTDTASSSQESEVDDSDSILKLIQSHSFPDINKSQHLEEKPREGYRRGCLKRVNKYSKSLSSIEFTSSERSKECRSVGFANISVRNYNIILGDHPDCSHGPPICLGWKFEDFEPIVLDDYEEGRPPRRNLRQMLINYYHRKYILLEYAGLTEADLKKAVKKKNKVKRQRKITKALLPMIEVEAVVESAKRKCKRVVKKSDSI